MYSDDNPFKYYIGTVGYVNGLFGMGPQLICKNASKAIIGLFMCSSNFGKKKKKKKWPLSFITVHVEGKFLFALIVFDIANSFEILPEIYRIYWILCD